MEFPGIYKNIFLTQIKKYKNRTGRKQNKIQEENLLSDGITKNSPSKCCANFLSNFY